MPDFTLLQAPYLQPVLTVLVVSLLDRIWVWPDKFNPLTFARLLANRMAGKVNKDRSHSVMQQRTSGSLALLVLLLPLATLLLILLSFASFPFFFDALLLLIAIQFQGIRQRTSKVSRCLHRQQKALARDALAPLVLRETSNLSPLGIAKASIESLLLRYTYQYVCVVFWYLLLGGVAALCYRLLLEFSWCWNKKHRQFNHFGHPAAAMLTLLQWLPIRLSAASFALAEGIAGAWRGAKQRKVNQRSFLLAIIGGALGIELSGPVYYDKQKIRLPKLGGPRQVRHGDIQRALQACWRSQFILLVLSLLLATLLYAALNQGLI